jgi:hypothetical protein
LAAVAYQLLSRREAEDASTRPALQQSDATIAATLAPELRTIHLSTMDDVVPTERQMISSTPGIGFRFEDDFDSDGRPDLVLLGQYDDQGSKKSFVLVATRSGTDWTRSGLLTFDEQFLLGLKYEKTLAVLYCALCDYGARIRWTGGSIVAEPTRPHGAPL